MTKPFVTGPERPPAASLVERMQGLALSEAFWGHVGRAVAESIGALLDVRPEMVLATMRRGLARRE